MRSLLAIFLFILFPSQLLAATFKAEFVTASEAVLSNPHDIDLSADGKYIYAADLHHDRVAVLDAKSLKLVDAFGKKDGLVAPHDLHIGPDGKLYVADTGNDRIVIYSLNGSGGTKTGELSGGFYLPEGVFVHSDGRVYVTGVGSGNIVAFENGKIVAQSEGLSHPHDVISDRKGSFWVADSGNDRMLLMSRDLKVTRELKGDAYKFSGPRYQDITDDGLLIVADKNTHSVKVIGPDGGFVAVIGNGKRGKGPNVFTTPEGVVVRGIDLWLSDSGNNRITRYRIVR
jgi:DNA-binding beta-propeller fold protein YncE